MQSKTGGHKSPKDKDDMYEKAVEVILGQQRGSATLLQRALAVGYTRATRLLELMEEDGIVGAFNGSKSRDVLMTLDEWKAREEAIAEELANAPNDDEGGVGAEDGPEEAFDDEAGAAAGAGRAPVPSAVARSVIAESNDRDDAEDDSDDDEREDDLLDDDGDGEEDGPAGDRRRGR
jgi:S-DNA-T family DNA segregation ATPase FtsK/SpoIIIE